MKKNFKIKSFVAIFAASTLFACTQDGIDNLSVQTEKETEAMNELPKRRTYEEALAVAQDAIGLLGENSTTRSGKPRSINTADVQYIVNTSSTRSTEKPDTLMYVFNYDDNAGFAVVSANRATEELIAVTEQGNYVAGEETGNGGFDLYMDMAEQYVTMAAEPLPGVGGDDGMVQFAETKTEQTRTIIDWRTPLIDVKWGQGNPYNTYCKNSSNVIIDAGCLVTAVAQVLSYYKHPSSIKLDFDNYNTTIPLDWNAINTHIEYPCGNTCTASHDVIGKMFRQIGEELKIKYRENKSANDGYKLRSAFSTLGYAIDDKQEYKFQKVSESLSNHHPVYVMAFKQDSNIGHAWLIDGFRTVRTTTTDYIKYINSFVWEVIGEYSFITNYNHFNWGWDGNYNGYFSSGVFNPSQGYLYDESAGGPDVAYNDRMVIYTNIRKK